MMGVWCFCFEMGWRLRCEKSSSPVGEIRQGCFFVITQVHNCKILAHSEAFQHLGNYPTRLLFHSFFLSKTHLILLSPIHTPQKTPPIVCFLKKRRAIVCTLGCESKKSCTRFLGCMILTLYHQRYDCGGGEVSKCEFSPTFFCTKFFFTFPESRSTDSCNRCVLSGVTFAQRFLCGFGC